MAYHQDWLMRQIEAISVMLAYLLSGNAPAIVTLEEQEETAGKIDPLLSRLQALVADKQVCEAENLLYETLEHPSRAVLDAANWFYAHLNTWSDQELSACNFSREEIMSGLQEVCSCFGIPV